MRRIGLVIGVPLVCSLAGMSGCGGRLHEQTVSFAAAHVEGSGLDVRARNGSVTISREQGTEVGITATLRMTSQERIAQTSITAVRDANQVLVVKAEPPTGGFRSRESVSFTITVPEAQGVKAATSNGRIAISGLGGLADLSTSNGSISVREHAGRVQARTSNGRIEASGIEGPVDVQTSNGRVTIALTEENPGPARVRTSNGAVSLKVGRGFGGDLDIRTSNGSIRVPDKREVPGPFEIMTFSKRSAALRFGAGESSTVSTSNGSVRVEVGS